jgi:spore maturation protein CgeB
MKILFVGQLAEGQTTRMRMETLIELGHQIAPFSSQSVWNKYSRLSRQIQQKANFGPAIIQLNRTIITLAKEQKPDLLWGEKQEYLWPDTLTELRRIGVRLLHYTPDPYFSLKWKRTGLMDACMPLFDYVVTSKQYELDEYQRVCQKVIYTPLGYAEKVHRPVLPVRRQDRLLYSSEVAFLGGWEPRRETLLHEVAKTGCKLKIWGYSWDHLQDGRWTLRRALRLRLLAGNWDFNLNRDPRLANARQGEEVYGDAYAWALSGASIGIGFLRHICPDQHTTRTFEIPACGSMLLADRTDEHNSFFEEGKEAEFFSSVDELIDKVRFYLANNTIREQVAMKGYQRCVRSGYSYKQRLIEVLSHLR